MDVLKPTQGIVVYDNVFSFEHQQLFHDFCTSSQFTIKGWNDVMNKTNTESESHVHSEWSITDLENSSFLEVENVKKIIEDNGLEIKDILNIVVNLDSICDSHRAHLHYNQNVMLVYVNMIWNEGWGGETLFFDKKKKEIIFGSRFTPNRIIVFDGLIPHAGRPQHRIADKFRLSLAIFFQK